MTIKKLRNKGTGKIGYLYANKDVNYQVLDENDCVLGVYDTLPRLIEEWEDYKLNIWYNSTISGRYTIEIDFATDKEAKKAMDKLKAWKRLEDKGFSIYDWDYEFDMVDKPSQTTAGEPRERRPSKSIKNPKGAGRPRIINRVTTKTSQDGLRDGLTRATFIVPEKTLAEIKEIVFKDEERRPLKYHIAEALSDYVEKIKNKEVK